MVLGDRRAAWYLRPVGGISSGAQPQREPRGDVPADAATDSPGAVPLIPPDGLLLHIGVFKTGTTALQETLRHSPDALAAADVVYRGPSSWRFTPLRTLAEADGPRWREIVTALAAHPGRRVVSSENLCGCTDPEAARIVSALGGDRPVHILITVRTLADLLPSTWQQLLKRGMAEPYEQWLRQVVADAPRGDGLFWRRNDFPAQVRRWGALVGEDNLTVVVSDKRQPDRLLRITEGFLDLAPQCLQFHPAGKSNESLTHAEAELLRRVNEAVAEQLGEAQYHRLVRLGVFPGMHRNRSRAADPIPLPSWAADEMVRIGAEQAAALRAAGVRVIGDIDALAALPATVSEHTGPPAVISMDTAAAALISGLRAATRATAETPAAAAAPPERPAAPAAPSPRLRGWRRALQRPR